jgi:hypothetical protein
MPIDVTADDIRAALDAVAPANATGEAGETVIADEELTFEIRQAEAILADEIEPHADSSVSDDRLELVGALLAAAYYEDDGNGPLLSIRQGSAQVSYTQASEDTLTYFKRATQMDPTGRLPGIDNPTASLSVPDVR